MISIILYGRNDAHGYNLHKRGALSLNCLAEVLIDPDDEIVFVDYNSPDQIPTFPEAINDTLTDTVRKRLRIIRVREDYHRQFKDRTHLVALESQSRNIAIRRANPANRWILSTNTDMILVPRAPFGSLTAAIAELDDGFYHLPRFEVPEILWETLDRREAADAIERVAGWGRSLHLNEIVFGGYDNVYEAPGDFQLFLRDDIAKIGGFDEAMIRGWHVDSNIARRMKLLRGEVRTAVDRLFGYHCGHTRQATIHHKAGFVANSIDVFVRNVQDPVARAQLDDWGAPDSLFEERRLPLGGVSRIERALRTALTTPGPETSEVALNEASFDLTSYDASHVLPHLVNLLGELPHGQTVMLHGDDAALFEQLAAALPGLDLAPRFIWGEGPADCAFAEATPLGASIKRADVFVLQFPGYQAGAPRAWRTARWRAQRALEALIAAERERPKDDRRLIVLVNVAHSQLQNCFLAAMTFTAIPYTTRLRHGYVMLDPLKEAAAPLPSGRLRPYLDDDLAMLRQLVRQPDPAPGWERLSLDLPEMANEAGFDRADPAIAALLERGWEHVRAQAARCAVPPVPVDGRSATATRLCSAVDWQDPQWLALAEQCFGGASIYAQGARSRWTWERVSLVHALRAHLSNDARSHVLVVTSGPDCLPGLIAYHGYQVVFASFKRLVGEVHEAASKWEEPMRLGSLIAHGDIHPLDEVGEAQVMFDGVVLAGGDFAAAGAARLNCMRAKLASLVRPGAYVGATLQVHLNRNVGGGAVAHREWSELYGADGAMARLGATAVDEIDARIPVDCVVRFAHEDATRYAPGLSYGWGDAMVTLGLANGRLGQCAKPRPVAQVEAARFPTPIYERPEGLPEPVARAAQALFVRGFACRLIPGLIRELTSYLSPAGESDRWWLLPVERGSGGAPATLAPAAGVEAVWVIKPNGAATPARRNDAGWLVGEGAATRVVLAVACQERPQVRIG